MNYGFTLKQAIEQAEADLNYFDGKKYIPMEQAMEVITDSGSAPISTKNETPKEQKPQSISEMARSLPLLIRPMISCPRSKIKTRRLSRKTLMRR